MIFIANIVLSEGEPLEKALRRFKRMVEKEGIVRESKRKRYFQKPSTLKHLKKKDQVRKAQKKQRKMDRLTKY